VRSAEKYELTIVKETFTRFLNLSPKITELEEDKFYIFNNSNTLKVEAANQKYDLEGFVFQVSSGGVRFYKEREEQGVPIFFSSDNVINIEIVMNDDTFNKCNDLIYNHTPKQSKISYNKRTGTFFLDSKPLNRRECYKFKNITQLYELEEFKNIIHATAFIVWPRGIEFVRFDENNNPITARYEEWWLSFMTMTLEIHMDEEIINSLPAEIDLIEDTTTAKIKIKEKNGKHIEKGDIAFKQYKKGFMGKADNAEQPILKNKTYSFAQSKSTVKRGENTITGFKVDDNNLVSLFNGGEAPIGQFPMPVDFTVKYNAKGGKRRTRKGRSKKSRKSIRRR